MFHRTFFKIHSSNLSNIKRVDRWEGSKKKHKGSSDAVKPGAGDLEINLSNPREIKIEHNVL